MIADYFAQRPSKQFFTLVLGFVAGVFVRSGIGVILLGPWWWYAALAALIGIVMIYRWPSVVARVILLASLGVILGVWRYDAALPGTDATHVAAYNGRGAIIEGVVVREPRENAGSRQVVVAVSALDRRPAHGRVRLILPRTTAIRYGELIRASCDLEAPATIQSDAIFSVCPFPDSVRELGFGGNRFVRDLLELKFIFRAALGRFLDRPDAALAAGLLLGDRRLPAEDAAAFRAAGVSHIIAVSGFNVAIILANLLIVFGWLGVPRRLAKALVVATLSMFVVITGGEPSIIRAGIMGLLPLLAETLGRELFGVQSLVIAAAAMLFQAPLLTRDAGFLLSFAAMAGILWLSPELERRWAFGRRSPYHILRTLRTLLIQTIAAIIATMPLVLSIFGTVSFVAPVANLFILFVVPAAMLASFLTAALGSMSPALGSLGGIVASPLLHYLRIAAHFFADLPFASRVVGHVPWIGVVILYALFVLWLWSSGRTRGKTMLHIISDRL